MLSYQDEQLSQTDEQLSQTFIRYCRSTIVEIHKVKIVTY